MSAPVVVNIRLTIDHANALNDFASSMLDDVPSAVAETVRDGLAIIEAALVVANAEVRRNEARDAQRAEAEREAAATIPTKVRIRITRGLTFKSGFAMHAGDVYDAERRVDARWQPKTDEWKPEVTYTVTLTKPQSGGSAFLGTNSYAVDASHAKEVA